MSKRVNKGKKSDEIIVDEKRGHLYVGDKDLRLIMLRPIDLIELWHKFRRHLNMGWKKHIIHNL
ncbi:MAG: hypothetical protein ACTSPS_19475 [Promethearchaeota archaeon]